MILIFTCSIVIQYQQDLSTLCFVTMTRTIHALMTCSWEERRFYLELKESMTPKFWDKEQLPKVLTPQPLKTILKALNMELIPMEEEELVWREWWCFTVHWRTLETHLCSLVIPNVSLLDYSRICFKYKRKIIYNQIHEFILIRY